MSSSTEAILLAAGKSSRFNTSATKLSFTICGQEMIRYPLNLLASMGLKTTVVVGYQQEAIRKILDTHNYNVTCVEQGMQKGTGHALLCTKEFWTHERVLIMNGDAPLLTSSHLTELIQRHEESKATISLIASFNADPTITGYGRIVREGKTIAIVEQREFTGDPTKECLLNAGVYLIERSFLEETVAAFETHPGGEIFITDLVKKASDAHLHVEVVTVPFDYTRGINTLKELWVAERLVTSELISGWMEKGVRFFSPESVSLDVDVTIEPDTTIGHGVQLRKGTRIGRGVTIEGYSVITGAVISDSAKIFSHSVIADSIIHKGAHVGPFAHVHKQSSCHTQSVVGNFVEVSKSTIGALSKAKHLTYLGQAHIGKEVTIGAGTITCNFDGTKKHQTIIKDHAFIGSNSALIAPITIGQDAIIAAGSTITQDVPANALAIARQRQVTKKDYAPLIRQKGTSQDESTDKLKIKFVPQGS